MVKVYGIKNCDSVRKAVKYLKSHDIPYELTDFKETSVGEKEISEWLQFTDVKTLFNTRGTTYRNLKLKELNLDDIQKEQWLSKENMLIKRPVITFDKTVIVGYNEIQYNILLPAKG